MMRIILLLLVTLTGPFCTFTQASTLPPAITLESTVETKTDPELATVKEDTHLPEYSTQSVTVNTEIIAVTTEEAPVASTMGQMITSIPANKTSTEATESTKVEIEDTNNTNATPEASPDATTTSTEPKSSSIADEVETEDNEAMGTGQVVGIVIGALIGVIVVIAIIILVVRRMGQYSPAKKRKPQKQESIFISPLKRKARQEEKKKKSGKF